MAESPFDASGMQWAWNATSLSLLTECPRKYQLSQVQGWRSRRPSPHLSFGGWYASALEHYHKLRAEGEDHDQALRLVIVEALISTWEYNKDDFGNPVHDTGYPWDSQHNLKTRETLIRSIIWYLDHFEIDTCATVILDNGRPGVELSFQMELNSSIVLVGHLDRLVTYQNATYVTDNKTTGGALSANYFDQWDPNTQMSIYTVAAKVVFNTPVKGVIIDAAQIAVGFTRFARGYTFRSAAQSEEFLSEIPIWVANAKRYHEAGHYPMNAAACGNYGGCQFRKICSRDPGVRERFLSADFEVRPFNPLEVR